MGVAVGSGFGGAVGSHGGSSGVWVCDGVSLGVWSGVWVCVVVWLGVGPEDVVPPEPDVLDAGSDVVTPVDPDPVDGLEGVGVPVLADGSEEDGAVLPVPGVAFGLEGVVPAGVEGTVPGALGDAGPEVAGVVVPDAEGDGPPGAAGVVAPEAAAAVCAPLASLGVVTAAGATAACAVAEEMPGVLPPFLSTAAAACAASALIRARVRASAGVIAFNGAPVSGWLISAAEVTTSPPSGEVTVKLPPSYLRS